MLKECIICQINFETNINTKKTCSKQCKSIHRNNTQKLSTQNNLKVFNCKYCKKEFKRYSERSGFCSLSCGSKYNIEIGTFDKWRQIVPQKERYEKICTICNEKFFTIKSKLHEHKTCKKKDCVREHRKRIHKINPPHKGIKLSEETKKKIQNTCMERYGVKVGFLRAKQTRISKPQKEIFDYLCNNLNNRIVLSDSIVKVDDHVYRVDYLIEDIKLIIEFNGTYWHCDPRFYKEDYIHTRKKHKTAKEIWDLEEKRLQEIKNLGYNVKIIWEYDYTTNKELVLQELLNECKKENINVG